MTESISDLIYDVLFLSQISYNLVLIFTVIIYKLSSLKL